MSTIRYKCSYDNIQWQAQINTLTNRFPIEAVVTGRGYSFDIIYGKYQCGYYLVIPAEGIGCEMSWFDDKHWNLISLKRAGINKYEAETLAEGIRQLAVRQGEKNEVEC